MWTTLRDAGPNPKWLWLLHELTHAEQCVEGGGREKYALRWWGELETAVRESGETIDVFQTTEQLVKQLQALYLRVHGAMPMEQAADAKAEAVLARVCACCCIAEDGAISSSKSSHDGVRIHLRSRRHALVRLTAQLADPDVAQDPRKRVGDVESRGLSEPIWSRTGIRRSRKRSGCERSTRLRVREVLRGRLRVGEDRRPRFGESRISSSSSAGTQQAVAKEVSRESVPVSARKQLVERRRGGPVARRSASGS